MHELNESMKNAELEMTNYKREAEEAELRLKELKVKYDSTRSDRNLYSKQLLETNVSYNGLTNGDRGGGSCPKALQPTGGAKQQQPKIFDNYRTQIASMIVR